MPGSFRSYIDGDAVDVIVGVAVGFMDQTAPPENVAPRRSSLKKNTAADPTRFAGHQVPGTFPFEFEVLQVLLSGQSPNERDS